MTVAAATTTEVFLAFVQQVLLPALQTRPDSIVAMDNLAPHKAACVRQAFEAAGVAYRYLPPYSPDLNPIEPAWAQIKGDLRKAEARSLAQLDAAMPHALEQVTSSNAQGWFRMKGYRSN
jgi:transposase